MNNIKMARVMKSLSQEELAQMMGVTQGTISQWEKGITHPTIKRLARLSRILNISVTDLIEGSDEDGGAVDVVLAGRSGNADWNALHDSRLGSTENPGTPRTEPDSAADAG